MTGRELAKALERKGWSLLRIHGSHHIYGKAGSNVRLSVPIHGNKPLKVGLLSYFSSLHRFPTGISDLGSVSVPRGTVAWGAPRRKRLLVRRGVSLFRRAVSALRRTSADLRRLALDLQRKRLDLQVNSPDLQVN